MADKTITFSKSIVAQKDISEYHNNDRNKIFITQLSKPIILKGVSTKTCQNVLYSIDGIRFTAETTIGDGNVLSMAIVPFQIGGADIDSHSAWPMSKSALIKTFSYILGGRDVNEDINIDNPISKAGGAGDSNGAYRYLLQYLAKNKNKIEWDTGDLFTAFNADSQDSFGGSDFITENISVTFGSGHEFSIAKQSDANGSILKPEVMVPDYAHFTNNNIKIKQSPYFFLYPEGCPASDGNPDKLIIDNFWRGGGLIAARITDSIKGIIMLYIFAVS